MKKRIIFSVLFLAVLLPSCHVGRYFIYNFAGISDYKKFQQKELKKAPEPFYFKEGNSNTLRLPKELKRKNKTLTFEEMLRSTGTVAFLAIRNDSILYQWYAPRYEASSIVPSFSMAKSYVSALVGIALHDGAIKSTAEPITTYLDFLNKEKFGKITIQHLLDMQSGIYYNEHYNNPFADVGKYYYGTNLKKYVRHMKIKEEPGKNFEYISLNTQLLGLIIEKATGKDLTAYLQEKIWSQIGTEFDAGWSIDSRKHGTEKAFCCINARARDYAKFGRLYLRRGNWQGRQVVPESWVDESVNFKEPKNRFIYSNQWWHTPEFYKLADTATLAKPYEIRDTKYEGKLMQYVAAPSGDYFAEGFLGQFIYVYPSKNIIFVKLAKKDGWLYWPQLFKAIAEKN